MKNLLFELLCMTFTGSIVFLLFRLAETITKHHFNASWHYNLLKCVALFFCIPFGQLNHIFLLNEFYINDILTTVNPAKGKVPIVVTGIIDNFNHYGVQKESLITYLVTIWVIGMLILFIWQSICYSKFRFTIAINKRPASQELNEIAILCAKQLKINKTINLSVNEFIDTPMMIGFLSPVILLPTDRMDPQSAQHVLTHELIHYKNHDLFVKFGMLFIRILHWYNPIIYLFFKEIDKWCEYTCDEKNVIHLSQDIRKQYGRVILDAISVMPSYGVNFGSPFLLPKQRLKERLIFMFNVRKMRLGAKVLALSLAAMLMTMGVTAAFAAEITNNSINEVTLSVNLYPEPMSTIESSGATLSIKENKLDIYSNTNKP